jgi:transposase
MGAAVEVTRTDHTALELRHFASKSSDGAQVRRLLALALLLEGRCRCEAAAYSGMDRQTLCDWTHRYNEAWIEGLKSRGSPGRVPALSATQKAELKALVVAGPFPPEHKVVRWRCVDLQAEVARRFCVDVHEGTIGRWLHELGLTRLQPRPCHPRKVAEAEEAFKKLRQPAERRASVPLCDHRLNSLPEQKSGQQSPAL